LLLFAIPLPEIWNEVPKNFERIEFSSPDYSASLSGFRIRADAERLKAVKKICSATAEFRQRNDTASGFAGRRALKL
jgi:hypothetical protein